MRINRNVLGLHAARIESEYLERLHKVRFGMDRGWRPPGLLIKGGTAEQRATALYRLKELALHGRFLCSYVALSPDLRLQDTGSVCRAAIEAAGLAGSFDPAADPLSELKRLAASSRQSGHDGWILLIDNVDRFDGEPRARAEAYRELVRWMGGLPDEQYIGLFCVLAVTPEFEAVTVRGPGTTPGTRFAEHRSIREVLRATGSAEDLQLLDAAEGGIGALEHEVTVHELLVLEW